MVKAVDNSKKKTLQDYPYLMEIRDELILELEKRGLSTQNIAFIFSNGITKGRVHQIIQEKKKQNVRYIRREK